MNSSFNSDDNFNDNSFDDTSFDDNSFDEIFGTEFFESSLTLNDSNSNEDSFDEIFEGVDYFEDLFGEEEFLSISNISVEEIKSNMEDWLTTEENPELINLNYKNPNNTVYFIDNNFNYTGDYSNMRFIFERFRSDLLEGEL